MLTVMKMERKDHSIPKKKRVACTKNMHSKYISIIGQSRTFITVACNFFFCGIYVKFCPKISLHAISPLFFFFLNKPVTFISKRVFTF